MFDNPAAQTTRRNTTNRGRPRRETRTSRPGVEEHRRSRGARADPGVGLADEPTGRPAIAAPARHRSATGWSPTTAAWASSVPPKVARSVRTAPRNPSAVGNRPVGWCLRPGPSSTAGRPNSPLDNDVKVTSSPWYARGCMSTSTAVAAAKEHVFATTTGIRKCRGLDYRRGRTCPNSFPSTGRGRIMAARAPGVRLFLNGRP